MLMVAIKGARCTPWRPSGSGKREVGKDGRLHDLAEFWMKIIQYHALFRAATDLNEAFLEIPFALDI
jgi:hypothetical protein